MTTQNSNNQNSTDKTDATHQSASFENNNLKAKRVDPEKATKVMKEFLEQHYHVSGVLVGAESETVSTEDHIKNVFRLFCVLPRMHFHVWDCFRVSNGSAFLAPDYEGIIKISFVFGNPVKCNLSAEAAGLTVTCHLLELRAHLTNSEELFRKVILLKQYAKEHPEATEIFKFLK